MKCGIQLTLSFVAAYAAAALGYVLSEAIVYVDGSVTDGQGRTITALQMLPMLATDTVSSRFMSFFAPYSMIAAGFGIWCSRTQWFEDAGVLAITVLSAIAGTAFGFVLCVLTWLTFGGWGPPVIFAFIFAAITAVFTSAIIEVSRHRSDLIRANKSDADNADGASAL